MSKVKPETPVSTSTAEAASVPTVEAPADTVGFTETGLAIKADANVGNVVAVVDEVPSVLNRVVETANGNKREDF